MVPADLILMRAIAQDEAADYAASYLHQVSEAYQSLIAQGEVFLIADFTQLPFADDSADEVITNSVPIDTVTHLGPGAQSGEIRRILKPGGVWVHDTLPAYTKP